MTDATAGETSPAPTASSARRRRIVRPRRGAVRWVLLALLIAVLTLVAWLGWGWWTHGRFVQSTNDAYLRADQVTIAPRVSGYVDAVLVEDNQTVHVSQPLVRINAASYEAQAAQQQAQIEARRADIAAAERQVAQQQAAVDQSRAQLAGARTNLAYAQAEAERYRVLSGEGVEPQQRYAQAKNQRDQAAATVASNADAVRVAERQGATIQTQIGQARAQLAAAQASARAANITLGETVLTSSIDGRVGDRTVRVGQFVQPGARLMSIVPVSDIYLVGNFKETQIAKMRVGQRATVKIDALGGRQVEAVLDSFAPGTGAQFALLPPENATGNFTKIVQRVPVRFRLRPPAELRDHLLPGLSAKVSVDTAQPAGTRR